MSIWIPSPLQASFTLWHFGNAIKFCYRRIKQKVISPFSFVHACTILQITFVRIYPIQKNRSILFYNVFWSVQVVLYNKYTVFFPSSYCIQFPTVCNGIRFIFHSCTVTRTLYFFLVLFSFYIDALNEGKYKDIRIQIVFCMNIVIHCTIYSNNGSTSGKKQFRLPSEWMKEKKWLKEMKSDTCVCLFKCLSM